LKDNITNYRSYFIIQVQSNITYTKEVAVYLNLTTISLKTALAQRVALFGI